MRVKVRDILALVVGSFAAYAAWKVLRRRATLPALAGTVLRGFTAEELAGHRGTEGDPSDIFISVKGVVYRVSPQHYGPGESYHCFAGSEASYRLGKGIVAEVDANREWRFGALAPEEEESLNFWAAKISRKYPVVGWFVNSRGERCDGL